jgi:hypothetical protein
MKAMTRSSDDDDALARFAHHVDRLTDEELLLLHETWAIDDEAARHRAWLEVRALAEETGRSAELRELQDGLVRWAGVPGRSGLLPFSVLVPSLREEADQRRANLGPLLDAGAALLLRDRLSAESFSTLMHPWSLLTDAADVPRDAAREEAKES